MLNLYVSLKEEYRTLATRPSHQLQRCKLAILLVIRLYTPHHITVRRFLEMTSYRFNNHPKIYSSLRSFPEHIPRTFLDILPRSCLPQYLHEQCDWVDFIDGHFVPSLQAPPRWLCTIAVSAISTTMPTIPFLPSPMRSAGPTRAVRALRFVVRFESFRFVLCIESLTHISAQCLTGECSDQVLPELLANSFTLIPRQLQSGNR
jgi:hypothetical protein